jgi:curved DNA-binding protein CbpA
MANLISQYPIPLISKKIYRDNLSGNLYIKTRDFEKNIFFNHGRLAFATTTRVEERLVQILYKNGIISREHLLELDRIKTKGSDKKVGEILREICDISQDDIHQAILYQTKSITVNSFSILEGNWVFKNRKPVIPNSLQFNLDLSGIIKEGTLKLSDLYFFINKFQDCFPVPIDPSASLNIRLSADEINLLKLLRQNSASRIRSIVSGIVNDKTTAWKRIVLLYLLNLLFFSVLNPEEERIAKIKIEIEDLFGRIESNSINYYQLLGLNKTNQRELIKQNYLERIAKYHPDKLSLVKDSVFQDQIERVVAELNLAYSVLQDNERRSLYDARGRNLDENVSDEINLKQRAGKMYLKADQLYKEGEFQESLFLMERAVVLDELKSQYYLLLGMNQAKIPEKRRAAEESFNKAIKLDPLDHRPLQAMGELFTSEGLFVKADSYFKRVKGMNSGFSPAGKVGSLKRKANGKNKKFFLFKKS